MPEYICPQCGKPIYDDEALLCLYCGESLRRSIGFMGKIKYPTPKLNFIISILLLIVVGVFLLYFLFFELLIHSGQGLARAGIQDDPAHRPVQPVDDAQKYIAGLIVFFFEILFYQPVE